MSDAEDDPYAVSSDSSDEDDEKSKKPPPKINIEGRSVADLKQIKESLTNENKETIKDEKTLEEIEQLRKTKGQELSKFKKDFEQGTVDNTDPEAEASVKEVEKPTGLDKQTLSAFKNKFEKMDETLEQNLEERLRGIDKELEGVGKDNLKSAKGVFENPTAEFKFEKSDDLLQELQNRSEADKRRVHAAFQAEKEEEPKNCCICDKIVYPVEKIIASKKLYHTQCFKCSKCGKKLGATTFNSHQGTLYCRTHMLEVLHPERAGTMGGEAPDDDESETIHVDEDDEYAVTSKPKQLGADVIRAGNSNIEDELSAIKSLKEKKDNWQSSVNEANQTAEKRSNVEEIESGKVKANLDKFISGVNENENVEDEEKQKQLDAIREQVSEVKNKWKTGDLEKAESHVDDSKEELEELKKGIKVKERFSERLAPVDDENIQRSYDRSELENSSAANARKSFLEGAAYQTGPIEKSGASELQDLKFVELNAFKDRFEKGNLDEESSNKTILDLNIQLKGIKEALEKGGDIANLTPEERTERKKQEIEAEFLRYKLARKIQSKRQKEREAEEGGEEAAEKGADDLPTAAEVGSIKNRFEAGEAYRSFTGDKSELDVDIKMAGKAREKFKNIDAQNPGAAPVPKNKSESKPSKWDKKVESSAEIVNKREQDFDDSDDEDDEAFDVKNLMNKFKNIESIAPNKIERKLDELEALRVEAKNLREKFEKTSTGENAEQSEEKKRQLEEEFRILSEAREKAKQELENEKAEEVSADNKEEIQVAAEHASKMTAKWEKIHKKEAKKAQKGQMPSKS